jgi:triacylglycerol lipase
MINGCRNFLNKRISRLCCTWLFFCFCNLLITSQAADQGINFVSIQQQALFANAAYLPEKEIRELKLPQGYSLTLYRNSVDTQISFFLASNEAEKTQVISIRGTSNIENAMIDINLKLTPDDNLNVFLHHGFAYAARQVYAEIKPLLKKGFSIKTTGHSLGGAVAVILAALIDKDGFNLDQVITFGQPKVTNLTGADKFQHLNIIRVVTPKDLVPLVPLFDPLDINNIDIFWHAGKEVILLKANQYAVLEGIDSMLRATRFTQQLLTEENLQHHQMSLYLQLLESKIDSATEVSYENSFNLFNLFGSE